MASTHHFVYQISNSKPIQQHNAYKPNMVNSRFWCIFIDRVAEEIIRLVSSMCVSIRLSVGALLFEPFDL